jgi:hypothetical protein
MITALGARGAIGLGLPTPAVVAAGPPPGGWWTTAANCVAAYGPIGAASFTASKTDLTGNGHNLSNGSYNPSDWDTALGWGFGSTYLSCPLLDDPSYTLAVRFAGGENIPSNGCILMGVIESGFSIMQVVAGNWFGACFLSNGDPGTNEITPPLALAGVLITGKAAGYKDGSNAGTFPAATPWTPHYNIYIGAANQFGTASWFFDGFVGTPPRIKAVWIGNGTYSDADMLALSNAMAAL